MTASGSSERMITLEDFHHSLDDETTVKAKPSDTVDEVEMRMDSHNIDQVPVVDPKSELMVLTRRMISRVPPIERTAMRVSQVPDIDQMPWAWPASTLLPDAAPDLVEHDWVITTDEDDKPVGLATVGDALKEALSRLNG